MDKDIKKHIDRCEICMKAKKTNNRKVQEFHLRTPPYSGHSFAIDLLGGIPRSGKFNQILVVVCTLTRYALLRSLESGTAEEVIKHLREIFRTLGSPVVLSSDNAGAFTSHLFKSFLAEKNMNIKHHLITPYSPTGNSLAERSIRSVLSILRVLCQDKPKSWHILLPDVEQTMNEGFNLTLRERPYYLYYGKDPRPNCTILMQNIDRYDESDVVVRLKYAYMLLERELQKDRFRRDNRPKGKLTTYQEGDIVYLETVFVNDKARKIRYPYFGPFRIDSIRQNSTTLINLATGESRRASMRNIKLYRAEAVTHNQNPNANRIFPTAENNDISQSELDRGIHPDSLRASQIRARSNLGDGASNQQHIQTSQTNDTTRPSPIMTRQRARAAQNIIS